MRWLALLLLVANLAFVGWRYAVEEDERVEALQRDPPVPAGIPRIQTLPPPQAGLANAPAPEQINVATAAGGAALVGAGVCVHNGPYARRSDADALVEWSRTRAARLQVRQEALPGVLRHALYLVPAPRAGEQDAKARPVESGSLDHALLLGVLDTQADAAQRATQVSQPGYRALVVPRLDTRAQWFVEAELASGFEDVGEVPPALVPGGKVTQVDCASL